VPLLSRGLLLLILAATCLLPGRAAGASPSAELDQAKGLFRAGNYAGAAAQFGGLLYPESKLADRRELAETHLLLGVSYFELGQKDSAEREFEEALALDRTLSLTTAVASKSAVEMFEDKKGEIERKARADEEARAEASLQRAMQSAFVVENRRYILNFVPFGAGQYQNKELGKAIFFSVSEASLGGVSLGLYLYQLFNYSNGEVPPDEVDTVRTLQVLQISSGVLCLGIAAWGIIDSLAHYDPVVRRPLSPAERRRIEEELRKTPGQGGTPAGQRPALPAAPPASSSLHLIPILSPGGAGVALSWEF
jgi:tetratricopeptide (TPR) repeat protein